MLVFEDQRHLERHLRTGYSRVRPEDREAKTGKASTDEQESRLAALWTSSLRPPTQIVAVSGSAGSRTVGHPWKTEQLRNRPMTRDPVRRQVMYAVRMQELAQLQVRQNSLGFSAHWAGADPRLVDARLQRSSLGSSPFTGPQALGVVVAALLCSHATWFAMV